jgi:hypothetical protein
MARSCIEQTWKGAETSYRKRVIAFSPASSSRSRLRALRLANPHRAGWCPEACNLLLVGNWKGGNEFQASHPLHDPQR